MSRTIFSDRLVAWQNNKAFQIQGETNMKDIPKTIVDVINSITAYLCKAFGIGPEEPTIIADHPPIHMVDGEIRLGNKE